MRELKPEERSKVSGAGGKYCGCHYHSKEKGKKRKGNNGFGNGGNDGSPNGKQDYTR